MTAIDRNMLVLLALYQSKTAGLMHWLQTGSAMPQTSALKHTSGLKRTQADPHLQQLLSAAVYWQLLDSPAIRQTGQAQSPPILLGQASVCMITDVSEEPRYQASVRMNVSSCRKASWVRLLVVL